MTVTPASANELSNTWEREFLSLLAASEFEAGRHLLTTLGKTSQAPELMLAHAELERSAGNLELAVRWLQRYLAVAGPAPAIEVVIADLYVELGRFDAARSVLVRVLSDDPENARLWASLASICLELGDSATSLSCYQRAIGLDPDDYASQVNAGILSKRAGDTAAAEMMFRRAIELESSGAIARYNLAILLADRRQFHEAVELAHECVRRVPESAEFACLEGSILREIGFEADAIKSYEAGLARDPDHQTILKNLFAVYCSIDSTANAKRIANELAKRTGKPELWHFISMVMTLPTVANSSAEIDATRGGLRDYLEKVQLTLERFSPVDFFEAGFFPPLVLDHQGRDDRAIKGKLAQIVGRSAQRTPSTCFTKNEIPKVGFLVTAGHESVFLRSFAGALRLMDSRLDIRVYGSASGAHRLRHFFAGTNVIFEVMPDSLSDCVSFLASKSLDLLHFWEIGSDSLGYGLALHRLARVQGTSFGLQTSTGIRTVDYYLSSRFLEGTGGESRYTEKLLLLDELPAYVEPPAELTRKLSRGDLALPSVGRLYYCPHRLAKFHPDFDAYLSAILERDKDAFIVLSAGRPAPLAENLRARWRVSIGAHQERIIVFPEMRGDRYFNLYRLADVVLDTHPYGGVNTSYDAFSQDAVVITQAGEDQRSRYASGCYSAMAITFPVAHSREEYIEKAIQIGQDASLRDDLVSQIKTRKNRLFSNSSLPAELSSVFLKLAND